MDKMEPIRPYSKRWKSTSFTKFGSRNITIFWTIRAL